MLIAPSSLPHRPGTGAAISVLGGAIADGTVPASLVRSRLANLFRVQFRLGLFDPAAASKYASLGPSDVDTPAHRALALEAARQGLVLLKVRAGATFGLCDRGGGSSCFVGFPSTAPSCAFAPR